MMLAIFGTPSQLTYWVMNTARLAAEVINGPMAVLTANTIDELRVRWAERGHKPVLFHADTPKRDLVELFLRIPGEAIVVIEALDEVVWFTRATRGLDPQTALRFATRSVCTLEDLLARSGVWSIDGGILDLSLVSFSDLLIDRLFSRSTPDECAEMRDKILAYNSDCLNVRQAVDKFVKVTLADRHERSVSGLFLQGDVAKAANVFEACFHHGVPRSMIWPPGVFVKMSDLSYLEGPIDLTGPARVLIGGHSLSLPRGLWRATVEISVSDNMSGNTILSDIFAEDRPVCAGVTSLPSKGTFSYEMEFECSDPYYPIIFRISTMEGAIEGALNLNHVQFQQIG
ncbi:MAG: hypothetical protein Q8M31_18635 [Beijerinckiaceae bacterium]|nr:hypothetical protein [Beijerinckiaceae bacterium]